MITKGPAIGALIHKHCVVCGTANDHGLHVQFTQLDDGGVQGVFDCDSAFEGYPGKIHGGIISALLDGAMTNCIFARGDVGVTGELKVRYRHPVVVDRAATVHGWIKRVSAPLYITEAELVQDGQVKVTATAKFMAQPQLVEKG